MSRRRNKERCETFPMPDPDAILDSYALGVRWPWSLRRPLELLAAQRRTSVSGCIEAVLLEKLISVGLIETRRATGDD